MSAFRPFFIAVFCIAPVLVACGGGGGGTRSIPVLPSAGPASQAVSVSLVVPARMVGTGLRQRPAFVSPSTLGAKLTVSGAAGSTSVTLDLSSSSTLCTVQNAQRACTILVSAPMGNDTFSISTYDQAPQSGSIPTNAHVLGTGSVAQMISAGFSGSLTMYIDATVNGFGTLPAFSSLPADAAPHAYLFVLNPVDFDNNAITNGASDPFANPVSVTLAESGGSGHMQLMLNGKTAGSTATLTSSSDSVAAQYDGGGAPAYSASVTFSANGVTPMSTQLSPLYVTSTSPAFSNLSLHLAGASTTVPLTIDEANAPAGTAFAASSTTCANIAAMTAPVQNGASATFSVTGAGSSASCSVNVSDGTSTVAISVLNSAPATPTPSPAPTATATASPTPTPTPTPAPTWTTVPLGPSLYVSNAGYGEMVTYPRTGWSPNPSFPYNVNLTPSTHQYYNDYTAGGLICYDAVHNYVWVVSGSRDVVEAVSANANGTNVPAVATLQIGTEGGYPTGCAVDASGNVYVTAYGAVFSGIPDMLIIYPSGSTTAGTVIRGANAGLNIPRKPAVDAAGNVYVADSTGKDIRIFANPGTNAGIIDVAPSRTITYNWGGGSGQPWGVAVDASGHVFVADTYGIAGYVEAFPAGLSNTPTSNTPVFVIGGGNAIPSSPNALIVDNSGNLGVSCTGSIQQFDPASLSSAFGSQIAPSPYASIWGANTLISGATGIDAH